MIEKIKSFFQKVYSWLNDAEKRYHDVTHVLVAFFITTVINMFSGLWWPGVIVTMCYILIKEGLIDKFKNMDNFYDILHFVYGIMWALACFFIYKYYY